MVFTVLSSYRLEEELRCPDAWNRNSASAEQQTSQPSRSTLGCVRRRDTQRRCHPWMTPLSWSRYTLSPMDDTHDAATHLGRRRVRHRRHVRRERRDLHAGTAGVAEPVYWRATTAAIIQQGAGNDL